MALERRRCHNHDGGPVSQAGHAANAGGPLAASAGRWALTKRALRQRARAFLVEGPQAVGEALASGAGLTELFVTGEGRGRYQALVGEAQPAGRRTFTWSAAR